MDARERDDPDRDPVKARKTSRPCAIEDGEAPPTAWSRLTGVFRRRTARPGPRPEDLPPLEPESIPEPPEDLERPGDSDEP